MSDITLKDIKSGFNLSKINDNFETIEDVINDEIVHTTGGNNVMSQELDMNSNAINNVPDAVISTQAVNLRQLQDLIDNPPADVDGLNLTVVESLPVTLADGQLNVSFTEVDVNTAIINLSDGLSDRGELFKELDYKVINSSTIELTNSEPAGTIIKARSTKLTSVVIGDEFTSTTNYDTLALWKADPAANTGDVVDIRERTSGSGGGFKADVITGTGTVNPFDIIAHDTLQISLVLRETDVIDIQSLGAIGDWDGILGIDDTAVWAFAIPKQKPIQMAYNKRYKVSASLPIPNDTVILGYQSEAYGEQQHKKPSLLSFVGLTIGTWCLNLANGVRGVRFENFGIEGDWLVNGVDFVANNREIDFIDFSIQMMADGLRSNDAFVCVFDRMSVTCRGTGVLWQAGTTLEFRSIRLQGDKANGFRMQKGFHFKSPKLQNTIISGFCQFAIDAFYIDGSPTLDIRAFDWEDNTNSCITIDGTDELRLNIDSCSALLSPNSAFLAVKGTISAATKVYIKNLGGLTKHFSNEFNASLDWSTERFLRDDGATISPLASIEFREDFFETVKDGIDASLFPIVYKLVQGDLNWQTKPDTFTPTVFGGTVSGSASYSVREGHQYRVGNLVNFSVDVIWTGHTGTGDLLISGLLTDAAHINSFSVMFANIDAPGEFISGRLFPSGRDLDFFITKNNTFGSKVQMSAAGQVTVSGSYIAET